ncbi:MAG: DUF2231 domain-containing protein [Gammaproteobacteria bacterium]|nr:DUF2231 domain-containing protein [Gammaproteobacteria bacterium]
MARWSLWIGSALSVLTVAAGVYAYYTVNHDGPSHEWMTIHRNVALGTFLVFGIAAVWAIWCHRSKNDEPRAFNGLLVIGLVALLSTSWLGGELVYRYGLGVMSLPKSEGDGHDHDHGEGHAHNVQPSSSDLSHQDDLMGGDAVMSGEEMPTHEHTDNKPHAH